METIVKNFSNLDKNQLSVLNNRLQYFEDLQTLNLIYGNSIFDSLLYTVKLHYTMYQISKDKEAKKQVKKLIKINNAKFADSNKKLLNTNLYLLF
jgi:hypothetical protein